MPHKRSKFKLHQRLGAQSAIADDACTQSALATSAFGTSESAINHKHTPITYMPMLLTPEEVHEVQHFINNLIAKRAQGGCSTPPNASQPCTPRVFMGSEDDDHADADSIYGSQYESEWLQPLPRVPQFPVAGSDVGASSATQPAHPLHSNPGASSATQISHEPPAGFPIAPSVASAEKVGYTVSDTSVLATLDDGEWLDPLPCSLNDAQSSPEPLQCDPAASSDLCAENGTLTINFDAVPLEFIIWTAPSTGMRKSEKRHDTTNRHIEADPFRDYLPAATVAAAPEPGEASVPSAVAAATVLRSNRDIERHPTQSPVLVSDLEYLINKMETPTLRLAQSRFAPFPLVGANFKLSACRYIDSTTGCCRGTRCPYSHMMKPTNLSLANELQRHLDNGISVYRVPSDIEHPSTYEQPSEQLASTSLLACAPALGDRDCHKVDKNRPSSPISPSRSMHPVPHISAPH